MRFLQFPLRSRVRGVGVGFQACLRYAHLVPHHPATEVAGYYQRSLRDLICLYCGQGVFQVILDVFNIFDSYRDTDQAIGDSDFSSSFFSQRGVGHGGRMRN